MRAGRGITPGTPAPPAVDFMEPITRFLDQLPAADASSTPEQDQVTAAIQQATARLLSFVDDIDLMLDEAHAHAETVVSRAYAEAARIVASARLQAAEPAATDEFPDEYRRAA